MANTSNTSITSGNSTSNSTISAPLTDVCTSRSTSISQCLLSDDANCSYSAYCSRDSSQLPQVRCKGERRRQVPAPPCCGAPPPAAHPLDAPVPTLPAQCWSATSASQCSAIAGCSWQPYEQPLPAANMSLPPSSWPPPSGFNASQVGGPLPASTQKKKP